MTDQTIGSYRVTRDIGEGGVGLVFLATHRTLETQVAIKQLKRAEGTIDPELVERFRREAKAQARLNHPNIVRVRDFLEEDGHYYIVMDYFDCLTLKELLKQSKPSIKQSLNIIKGVLRGLAQAHDINIVHRDIKPANILITSESEAVITDFGIAHWMDAQITQVGEILGTYQYLSPEQIPSSEVFHTSSEPELPEKPPSDPGAGHRDRDAPMPIDPRSDIYSVGLVLFELLTGKVPFRHGTPEAYLKSHKEEALPNPRSVDASIPEGLSNIVLRATQKSQVDRYQSCGEFLDAIAEFEASSLPIWRRHRKALLIGGGSILILVLIGVGITIRPPRSDASEQAVTALIKGATNLAGDQCRYLAELRLQEEALAIAQGMDPDTGSFQSGAAVGTAIIDELQTAIQTKKQKIGTTSSEYAKLLHSLGEMDPQFVKPHFNQIEAELSQARDGTHMRYLDALIRHYEEFLQARPGIPEAVTRIDCPNQTSR